MFARNTCYATLMALAMLTTAAHAQVQSWEGFAVLEPIPGDGDPDAVHRDLHGAYNTIWMDGLVTAYEEGKIMEADLMRELWAEQSDLLVALAARHGSLELIPAFLIDLVAAQSNGIIGLDGDQPIFFDPTRYLDSQGNVLLGKARDYNAAIRANQILADVYLKSKNNCDFICAPPVNNRCCKCPPICHCRTSLTGGSCAIDAHGNCEHGSTMCSS